VNVAPGQKIPDASTLTGNTIHSNVRTDKESYDNSGAFGNAPVLPPVVTPQSERDQKGTGVLDLPPISKNLIPESSLPIGLQELPLMTQVQRFSRSAPKARRHNLQGCTSGIIEGARSCEGEPRRGWCITRSKRGPAEVQEKTAVEKELLSEVPTAPATSEGTAGKATADKSEKGVTAGEAAAAVSGAAVALGGAAAAYASNAASQLPTSITSKLPESVQNPTNKINAQTTNESVAQDTPEVVKESIAESGQAPEAAGNEEAVLEKKAVEKELLSEIKRETSTGESAPKISEGLAAPTTPSKPIESRDVSPGTVPGATLKAKLRQQLPPEWLLLLLKRRLLLHDACKVNGRKQSSPG